MYYPILNRSGSVPVTEPKNEVISILPYEMEEIEGPEYVSMKGWNNVADITSTEQIPVRIK